MKKTNVAGLVSGVVLAGALGMSATTASAGWSANVAITSDYVFRGYSQAAEDPAIQGGFDYGFDNGLYAGIWASNVTGDTSKAYNYDGASIEVDVYGGWGGTVGPVDLDVGVLRYNYPGTRTDTNNTNEWHVGVSKDFGFASAGLTFNRSDDFFGLGSANYVDLGVEVPVGEFTIAAHVGDTNFSSSRKGGDDYTDYSLGVSTELGGFGLDLTVYDTTGVQSDSTACKDLCDNRVVFTVSKSFE